MTSTLIPSIVAEPPTTRLVHWKTWVVPVIFLRGFIDQYKHIWQFRYSPPQQDSEWYGVIVPNENYGWRVHLALEISVTIRQSIETVQRNLYRVLSNEGVVINASFAEAIVMSVNLDIDRDTKIPVLPGNLRNAQELLEVRDPKFWGRTKDERTRLTRMVMVLCGEIITYPERLEVLQDAAPFDCLRPPR